MFGIGGFAEMLLVLMLLAALGVLYVISLALTGLLKLFRLPFQRAFLFGFGVPLGVAFVLTGWTFLNSNSSAATEQLPVYIPMPEAEPT
jgi:hypothetical protein